MKRCVYTALTGGYEPLNEQIMARQSELPFICFTDDPDTACDGWEIRPLQPPFPADDIRNQRNYKMQPHLMLPEFDQSLYIDNSVRLLLPPERLFEAADLSSGMCVVHHSYRESLYDEFMTILADGLDDPRRVAEQLERYRNAFPEVLAGPVFWSGMMLRDHHAPRVKSAMAIWLAHVYRYSRRDQLSNAAAFHLAGLQPGVLALDNFESEFHSWPNLQGRKAERRLWNAAAEEAVVLRTEHLEMRQALEQAVAQALGERDGLLNERDGLLHERATLLSERDQLLHERATLLNQHDRLLSEHEKLRHDHGETLRERDIFLRSTSWRLTAPMRRMKIAAMRFQRKNAP